MSTRDAYRTGLIASNFTTHTVWIREFVSKEEYFYTEKFSLLIENYYLLDILIHTFQLDICKDNGFDITSKNEKEIVQKESVQYIWKWVHKFQKFDELELLNDQLKYLPTCEWPKF